jgi:hypothetical protein
MHGQSRARRQRGRRGGGREPGQAPGAGQFPTAPHQYDEKPDQRDVSVSVGHGLHSHLHQADDRHEGSDIPKPAHRQIRPAARCARTSTETANSNKAASATSHRGHSPDLR